MRNLSSPTNRLRGTLTGAVAAIAVLCSSDLLARATPEEIASLGGEIYTPVGAERAGPPGGRSDLRRRGAAADSYPGPIPIALFSQM